MPQLHNIKKEKVVEKAPQKFEERKKKGERYN